MDQLFTILIATQVLTLFFVTSHGKKLARMEREQNRMIALIERMHGKIIVGSQTADRIEAGNIDVATDLRRARMRADDIGPGQFGEASDAAARSPKPKDD